jgi:hypothetical protein
MQVLEGTVTANGEDLSAGETFSTVPREPRALPVLPRQDAYFLAGDGTAKVDFTWTRNNYSGTSRFDLALDRRFHLDRIEKTQITGEETLSANLAAGVYWWRVYPENTAPGTMAERIIVLPSLKPELISPAEGHTFYQGQNNTTEFRFIWKNASRPRGIPDNGNYILEAADNSSFMNPRLSVNVEGDGGASLVYTLGEGNWYWRVREDFPGIGLPASVSYFTIARGEAPLPQTRAREEVIVEAIPETRPEIPEVKEEPLLPPPRGINPANRFVLGPEQIRRSRRLEFNWDRVPGATSYIFTLLEEGTRRTIVSSETVQNSYTVEDVGQLERGSFIWRVEAIRRNGEIIELHGNPGESRFTVDVPAPGNPRVRDTGVFYGQ